MGKYHPWEHPVCIGLSLRALLLSWVVELGVGGSRQVQYYSLKGGMGPTPRGT